MVGIIVNDSIVLVSTIDDYAASRPMRRAIIDAVADRLRAVFLTTATTVLGLAPLLFETSAQAIFLKPTVITLVYGLGFGMVLVLVLVPAVLAVQEDANRALQALRRTLRMGRAGRPVRAAAAVSAALFVLGPVWVLATGSAPVPFGAAGAFALFLGGSLIAVLAAGIAARIGRRPPAA
jgi:predicted RND superfamily exporter protein